MRFVTLKHHCAERILRDLVEASAFRTLNSRLIALIAMEIRDCAPGHLFIGRD